VTSPLPAASLCHALIPPRSTRRQADPATLHRQWPKPSSPSTRRARAAELARHWPPPPPRPSCPSVGVRGRRRRPGHAALAPDEAVAVTQGLDLLAQHGSATPNRALRPAHPLGGAAQRRRRLLGHAPHRRPSRPQLGDGPAGPAALPQPGVRHPHRDATTASSCSRRPCGHRDSDGRTRARLLPRWRPRGRPRRQRAARALTMRRWRWRDGRATRPRWPTSSTSVLRHMAGRHRSASDRQHGRSSLWPSSSATVVAALVGLWRRPRGHGSG